MNNENTINSSNNDYIINLCDNGESKRGGLINPKYIY
jgi:hypothetical protein